MRKISIIIAVFMLIPFVCSAEPVTPPEAETLANRVIELLANQDAEAVARLMHYPPGYTAKEREDDIAGVRTSINFLLLRFGEVSQVKRENGPIVFFEIGCAGGDLPYWQSLSPLKTLNLIYLARFSNLGVGVIKICIFRHENVSKAEIQSVWFGLPASRADAKSEIASAMKDMMRLKGKPLPPNIDEILDQNLRPEKHNI